MPEINGYCPYNSNLSLNNLNATSHPFSTKEGHVRASMKGENLSVGDSSSTFIDGKHGRPPRASAAQYYKKKDDMPSDPATLKRIEAYCVLATQPYYRQGPLPDGWCADQDILEPLATELQQKLGGNIKVYDGAIVDTPSGLTAMVFVNKEEKICMLSFGGTTSGKAAMRNIWDRVRPGHNFSTTMRQNFANVSAALGVTPTSYKQATTLARILQQWTERDSKTEKEPNYAGFSLHLTGHSKGGGEAMYAALKADTPIPATVFSPAHLSSGLIADLPFQNLEHATELIESYSAQGDFVPALRPLFGSGVGTECFFSPKPHKSGLDAHVHVDKHLTYYVGQKIRLRTLALQLALAANLMP
jgi:hypothetical protein